MLEIADVQRVPHIGVMCIDLAHSLDSKFGGGGGMWHSYLAASYVKQLEAAGALVIPIWIGRERAYYANLLEQLNGVLLPGGAVFIDDVEQSKQPELTNDCVKSAQHIYELALEKNNAGEYFPVWGTCLGFQLLMINAAKSSDVRTDCQPMYCALPLQLTPDYKESTLFKQLAPGLAEQMTSTPFACHQHRYCITEGNLRRFQLHTDWHVLATATDDAQQRFITLIEHRRFPIFGAQFHPERAAYEQLFARNDTCSAAHTRLCIQLAHYFASVFVDACRRNGNSFNSVQLKARHMICNWQPVFSGQYNESNWLQCYLFGRDVDYPQDSAEPSAE